MSKLLAILVLACALAAPTLALAKEFQLPDANPAVSVTLPDGWTPKETDAGAEAISPDKGTYVSTETATKKGIDALIQDNVDFLTKNNVKLKLTSEEKHADTINGMPVTMFRWAGTDDDGPTNVTFIIFTVTDNLVMLLTAWASPASEEKFGPDLGSIVKSVKKI